MRSINLFLILFFLSSGHIAGQKITVSGYVNDAESGERLIGAAVYERLTLTGTVTNSYGFFSLPLKTGPAEMVVSYLGYEPVTVSMTFARDTAIIFNLVPAVQQLNAVTVTASGAHSKVENPQMSMIDIPVDRFAKLPVLLGEADVLKVIQLLPGVQSGTEGSTGIYVRGGGPDQNLFLLDGVPVYNASHLFGFMSVFNPDAVKSVQLYKGGFPARYGERLSSVIDIRMKEGNEKETSGNFSVGLISSKVSVEGPVKEGKTSFIISARRTYADLLAKPLIAIAANEEGYRTSGGYYFYDLNGKINHKFSEKSRLYLSTYLGKDKAYFREKDTYDYYDEDDHRYEYVTKFGMGWGNVISSLRWNYLFSNRLFSNTTVTYSNYKFDITSHAIERDLTAGEKAEDYFRYFSGIVDVGAKTDLEYYPSSSHTLRFGAGYTYHNFKPGVTTFRYDDSNDDYGIDTTFGDVKIYGHELTAYAEDNIEITSRFSINAGARFSLFSVQDTAYLSLQPRFSARLLATEDLSFKLSYSRMTQFVHLLTTTAISLPTDLWLPVTKRFEPPLSDQVAVGCSFRLPPGLDLTLEAFYKTMDNLIEYKEGASFGGVGSGWEDKVEKGRGWAYGAEFMIEKNFGKTTGWIGYTLSWTERQFEKLNYGRVFPAKYDRRHDVSLALTHKFNERMDLGIVWVYGTGNAATLGVMEYHQDDSFIPGYYIFEPITEYESRNNYRMPSYHRLDLGFNIHKKKEHGTRTWNFSVYNAYNRKNPFFIFWSTEYVLVPDPGQPGGLDYVEKTVLKKVSLFPVIPSVSYSYKF